MYYRTIDYLYRVLQVLESITVIYVTSYNRNVYKPLYLHSVLTYYMIDCVDNRIDDLL